MGCVAKVILAVQVLGLASVPALPRDCNNDLTLGAWHFCFSIKSPILSLKSMPSLMPTKKTRSLFCETPYSVALRT